MSDSAEDRGTVHVPRTRGAEGCAEEVIGAPSRRCESRAAGKIILHNKIKSHDSPWQWDERLS